MYRSRTPKQRIIAQVCVVCEAVIKETCRSNRESVSISTPSTATAPFIDSHQFSLSILTAYGFIKNIKFRPCRHMPTLRANTLHPLSGIATVNIPASYAVIAINSSTVHRGTPHIQATIFLTIRKIIFITETGGIQISGRPQIGKIQILGHPPHITNFHDLVGLSITVINQSSIFAIVKALASTRFHISHAYTTAIRTRRNFGTATRHPCLA